MSQIVGELLHHPVNFAALKRNFTKVADRYQLSVETRKTAWQSAQANPEKAFECYRAICNTL